MRAVMALAARILVLHHGAAIAEGDAGGGRARSGGDRFLSRARRTYRDDAHGREPRRVPRRRPGARRRLARDRGGRHRRHCRRQRRRQDLAHPHHRRHAQAGARAHPLSRPRYRRLAEPQGLRSRHRPGRRRPPGLPVAVGRRKSGDGRHAAARARRARAQPRQASMRCFRLWPSAAIRPPARCRAASSRCSRSAAA